MQYWIFDFMPKRILGRFLDVVLFSNFFVACCAMAQGALACLLLSLPFRADVLAMLGLSTLAMYNFSMMLAKPPNPEKSPYQRVRWMFHHEKALRLLTILSLVVTLVLALRLERMPFLYLCGIALVSAAYNLPLLPTKKGTKEGLRSVYGAKLFYIALVWVLGCLFFPAIVAYADGVSVNWPQAFQLGCWMFLFIAAITLPFDIRDMYQDGQYGLKTIPALIGKHKSYVLCVALLSLQMVWVAMSHYVWPIRTALLAVTFVTLAGIFLTRNKKHEYYYFLALDGMMILQYLSVQTADFIYK